MLTSLVNPYIQPNNNPTFGKLPRWFKALGQAKASTANANVFLVGDSTTAGYGAAGNVGIGAQIYGFAMPTMQAMSLAGDKDPAGSLAKIADTRRQLLYSAAQNAPDAQSWNQNVASLAHQGWLSTAEAQQMYGHFENQARVLHCAANAVL